MSVGAPVLEIIASGLMLLLIDQWTKNLVQAHVSSRCLSWGRTLQIKSVPHRRKIYTHNSTLMALVLVWLAALTSAIILQRTGVWFQSQTALFGLGLAFGGSAGNLLDVLKYRYIVDFIDLRWWPIFNIGDVAIIGGLVAAFWPST